MNILRVIHRWIGIAIAIPVVLVAVSGGLLLFKDPYNRARYPALSHPITASEVAGYGAALERIERDFPDQVRVVRFPREGANAFLVYLRDGSEAFVHPASGETIARSHWQESLPAFLFQLHAHLLSGTPGEVVNGFIALFLVFMGLTGLLLWWPRRAAVFRLQRALPRSFAPSDLLRSHAASGVLVLLPVILFAATGAGLVFYDPASRIATALLDAHPPEEPSAVVPISEAPRRPWPEVLSAVRRSLPEAGPTMYYPDAGSNAVMTFRKSLPGEWHPNGRSYVLVDPYRADVVQAIDARAQGAGTRLMHALYPVHAAMVGGAGLVLLAVVAALGLTYLAIGGSYAYLARMVRSRSVPGRWVPESEVPRSGSLRPESLRRVPTSGVPTSGIPTSGVPTSGVPTSGVPTSGVPTSGVPNSGFPTSGSPSSGSPSSGFPTSGFPSSRGPSSRADESDHHGAASDRRPGRIATSDRG